VLIYEKFEKNVHKYSQKIALVFEGIELTYKELYENVEKRILSFKPYTHIGVYLENSIEFVELLLLASKYNLILIPFSTKEIDYKKFDIEYLYDGEFHKIKEYRYKESGYIIVSTSGSTSEPKPIVLTQQIKLERIQIAKESYNLNKNSICLVSTPMYHSLAQRGVLLPLVLGGTCILMKNFETKKYLENIQKYKVTFSFSVSNQLEIIKTQIQNYNVSSLISMVSTSYALSKETKQELLKYFDIYECYGTSEIGCVTHLSSDDIKKHLDSVGKPLKGVSIKIKNGEILVKSPWRFKEYYKMLNITKESFEDDFFKTGDLGEIKEGFLYYKGRKKELIKTGGISVYPMDIEKVLKKVNGVKEVAVIGIEDEYFGEAIIAVVVGDVKKIDLIKTANVLAPYQRPLFYDIVESLPKNRLGKLQKYKLKEKYKNLQLGKRLKGLK
jgi:long-chain acyl-CoA synthetase